MSNWVLPDHFSDVLPSRARQIEEIRRKFLDKARGYGYELIIPPLVEHLESLLTGTGESLDLYTFKLIDQYSGRTLGARADTTPQAARIDAHLLNREGVCRLCYCGSTLHAKAELPWSQREKLQFGTEIFGHAGIEAELEIIQLALGCLTDVSTNRLMLDLSHAGIVQALMKATKVEAINQSDISAALSAKDCTHLNHLCTAMPEAYRRAFLALPRLYGDESILDEAENVLPALPEVAQALSELRWLAQRLKGTVDLSFDLADARGYAYYSGVRFAIFSAGAKDALVRGGRYDGVGKAFGRSRPACGMSLDIHAVIEIASKSELSPAILAPWLDDEALNHSIRTLRAQGETVVRVLPGHEDEIDEFLCDRELVKSSTTGAWTVTNLRNK